MPPPSSTWKRPGSPIRRWSSTPVRSISRPQVQESLGQREDAIASYREVLALERDAQDTLVPLIAPGDQSGPNQGGPGSLAPLHPGGRQ